MNNSFDGFTKDAAQSVTRRKMDCFVSNFANVALAGFLALMTTTVVRVAQAQSSPPAQLAGRVVEDLAGNGISTDDTPIQGRPIRLFRDNGDQAFSPAADALVTTDITRRDGTYAFRNLSAGIYFVQQELPARWVQTAPVAEEHDDIVTPAQCGPTPKERNDTMATAIATGLSSAAPGTYCARGEIGDNNFKTLDVDMFKVHLNAVTC